MKFYAVKKGRQPGIYTNWPEAQKQVQGFSGAQYKSFTSQEEAVVYMEGKPQAPSDSNQLQAYVDGSYDKRNKAYGSGVSFILNGKEIESLSFAGDRDIFLESHQVAGECLASLAAIKWAVLHEYPSITICYDYQGVESWATGDWKTNKPISQVYKKEFDRYAPLIQVHFRKVHAHSGDPLNDRADQLAKAALGIG
ncbi:ribonuclease H family protein [Streptococcus sp. 121]|uniref:ribonuclease H1 domain-containing protein n=1 Tax=Streptococcus sp. 121 TaxID=2797637 RepID=UPI0018F0B450|nr:ribonuclease H family protein [Streptococcus sp. 121]MBJ6745797.1 ribonuclease H family protein [Streptococcus sp. 121]